MTSVTVVHARDLLETASWIGPSPSWGSLRAAAPAFKLEGMGVTLIRILPGQRTPWHGSGGWPEYGCQFPAVGDGSVYICVEGEVDFFAGANQFHLQPRDLLPINAVVYQYSNPGLVDCYFWCLVKRHSEGAGGAESASNSPSRWDGDPLASYCLGSHPYYDSKPTHMDPEPGRIYQVPWSEYRHEEVTWTGDREGQVGYYPPHAGGVSVRALRIPRNSESSLGEFSYGRVLLGLQEEPVELDTGEAVVSLVSGSAVAVPPGHIVRCSNRGARDVVLFEAWV